MEIVVQKYGGTSIGKADRMLNVASIVKSTLDSGQHPVVVLSAMSSVVKKEGTTSRLIEAAEAAIGGGAYYKVIDILEENHLTAINEMITHREIKESITLSVEDEFKRLKSFLDAIQVIGEISSRSWDVIIGEGEKLSAMIFAALLNSQGIDAEFVNLETVVDKEFKEVNREFCLYLQGKLAQIIKNCGSKIPVVTGYLGFVPGGILKSIGRGYTDFTAALTAAGLKAKELQVWKEVDGIYSADPNKVKGAKVLDCISPEEAMELTYYGSEVIHPFTMAQLTGAKVPLRIKNTFNPSLPGTIVEHESKDLTKHKATAVTAKKEVTVLNINSNRMYMAYGFMHKIFEIFNRHEIVIDLIATSEVSVSMTIDDVSNLAKAMPDLESLGDVTVKHNMAILSLVGTGMRHTPGIASKMFSLLSQEGINIEMISQGASEINISCVISANQVSKGLEAVHQMCI